MWWRGGEETDTKTNKRPFQGRLISTSNIFNLKFNVSLQDFKVTFKKGIPSKPVTATCQI